MPLKFELNSCSKSKTLLIFVSSYISQEHWWIISTTTTRILLSSATTGGGRIRWLPTNPISILQSIFISTAVAVSTILWIPISSTTSKSRATTCISSWNSTTVSEGSEERSKEKIWSQNTGGGRSARRRSSHRRFGAGFLQLNNLWIWSLCLRHIFRFLQSLYAYRSFFCSFGWFLYCWLQFVYLILLNLEVNFHKIM